jgi:hypothetical protein
MVGDRDEMERLIDRAEAQAEALWGLYYLLDEMDLAGVLDDQYWELYAVLNKMVSDFRSRFPDFGGRLPPEGRPLEDQ